MTETSFTQTAHAAIRVDIATGMPFEDFRSAFEGAAPQSDQMALRRIVADGGGWDDIRVQAEANAPHGLMIYAAIDVTALFAVAGNHTRAVTYLLGNHVVAESMFRHEPRAMLYAPLRALIHADGDDNAVFTMDRPSSLFGSLGVPEVASVGNELDRKVVALLKVVGVDARAAFNA